MFQEFRFPDTVLIAPTKCQATLSAGFRSRTFKEHDLCAYKLFRIKQLLRLRQIRLGFLLENLQVWGIKSEQDIELHT
jgi:hypothetical protein